MNKRIKKKKAKQALQREQERLAQEMTQLTPEHFEEVIRVINQSFHEISKVIACFVDGLSAFFKNLEVSFESIEQQGVIQPRPRTIQVQGHRQSHLGKKSRAHVKQRRGKGRQSWRRYQQANRKYSHQTKHRCSAKKPRTIQRNR